MASEELAGALVEEWGNISQQELANLVQSMRRCTAALNLFYLYLTRQVS
jgi:hypothetical protein